MLKQVLEPGMLCTQRDFRKVILMTVSSAGLDQEGIQGREVWEGRDRQIGDSELGRSRRKILGKWIFRQFMMGGSLQFGDLKSEMKAGEGIMKGDLRRLLCFNN